MTIEDNMSQSFEGLSCDDTQQVPAPLFQIVLVDIEKAAYKLLHCVEVPLELDKDLKYVAISYRWGELSERMIDTQLGYTASITSFDLDDFYKLCWIMSIEVDLREMKYVWIDTICVDQTNYERRKATIHHMSTIYECANYIVAVPDLHLAYLKKTAVVDRFTEKTAIMKDYICDILHGHGQDFVSRCSSRYTRALYIDENQDGDPLEPEERGPIIQDWENYMAHIMRHIPLGIEHLSDLITDWSSRVWVISEYHIAKRKKNKKMKYWFIQLFISDNQDAPFSFFEFDFADPSLTNDFKLIDVSKIHEDLNPKVSSKFIDSAYRAHQQFHNNMIDQVAEQNVVEMILKSKASKAEDRLYAVLPIFEKYKSKLQDMSVGNGKRMMMNTTISVRLKLFELFDSLDKLALLFISCNGNTIEEEAPALPTFVTSTIKWSYTQRFYQRLVEEYEDRRRLDTWNFDLSGSQSFLMLMPPSTTKETLYVLELKPKEYYVCHVESKYEEFKTYRDQLKKDTVTMYRLGLDDPTVPLDTVVIPFYIGSVITEIMGTGIIATWGIYRDYRRK